MKTKFKHIGLIGKHYVEGVTETLLSIIQYLQSLNLDIILEKETAQTLKNKKLPTGTYEKLGETCDLLIVIGGDGSLLHTARKIVAYNVPVIGVNRGTLGFLTDIKPHEFEGKLLAILKGDYQEEKRFLLEATITNKKGNQKYCAALNEIVFTTDVTSQMIEFEIYIDDIFLCSQRSDGMIITTPTGSTAYALSAGGPIIHPNLNAVAMIPMFPHMLSSRPIVIDADHCIKLITGKNVKTPPRIFCDSQQSFSVKTFDTVYIQKMKQPLRLIHPLDYDYYNTLRTKLGWGQRIIGECPSP